MTFFDISKIRQGRDIWCYYLQKFILNMDLICVLVVLVMITINNLQSLIMLDVNLGLINVFSNMPQRGRGGPKYCIALTWYSKVDTISIGQYLVGQYTFFIKVDTQIGFKMLKYWQKSLDMGKSSSISPYLNLICSNLICLLQCCTVIICEILNQK